MAEFNSVVTTENGLKLIALSAGMTKPLTFTRLAIGAGRPATGDDITKYTAVKNQKLIYSVSKIAPVSDGTGAARWSVYTAFSNDTLNEGFYMTEIGLYAKVAADSYTESGWNGYKGEEVLFGYAYALVDKADWLPDKSTPLDVMEWVIYASVGNASSVTAVIPAETCARAEDLTNHINDTNPHPKVFANYTKKTDFTAHVNDTNPHAKVFANYLKTADLTPVKLYDVLHSYGENFVPSDVSNSGWGALGSFISYYTQKKIKNQPGQYGQLINICAGETGEATQIWINQPDGRLAYRGGNGSIVMNDTPFTQVASLDEIKEMFYPRVGDIICTKNKENPSARYPGTTWELLSDGTFLMAGTASNVGTTGGSNTHTITTAEMPSHTHSVSCTSAGAHTHTRGTMNITGTLCGFESRSHGGEYTGAFYDTGRDGLGIGDHDWDNPIVGFDASRSWTGVTSEAGAHSHSISIGANGSGQAYDSRPKYLSVYMWIRTA